MATIKRIEDTLGRPVEFKAAWSFKGHRSRSNAEKDDLAREALTAEGQDYVNKALADGVKGIKFDHVELIANEDQGSETKKDPITQERDHRAWGTGVGYVYIEVDD